MVWKDRFAQIVEPYMKAEILLDFAQNAERRWIWRIKIMNKIDWTKIANAVEVVKMGICNRCDVDGIIVYKCGTVIRIDIKNQFE